MASMKLPSSPPPSKNIFKIQIAWKTKKFEDNPRQLHHNYISQIKFHFISYRRLSLKKSIAGPKHVPRSKSAHAPLFFHPVYRKPRLRDFSSESF